MKKIGFIFIIIIMLLLTGCMNQEEVNEEKIKEQEEKISILDKEISDLQKEKENLNNKVTDLKIEKGTAKYVLTLEIKQVHFVDLSKMVKDSINAIELQIPVDKEFYDSLEVGDVLEDSFRVGSLILEGSLGNWNIEVIDKEIQ